MSGVFIIFWGFFKVKSGVFLHNRVATLPQIPRGKTLTRRF